MLLHRDMRELRVGPQLEPKLQLNLQRAVASAPVARDRRLMGASTRVHMMIGQSAAVVAGKEYMTSRIAGGMPEYAAYDFYAFYPHFRCNVLDPANPEVDIPNDGSVWGSFALAGVFHQVSFDGQAEGVQTAGQPGRWGKIASTFTPGGSAMVQFRTIQHTAIGGVRPIGYSRISTLGEAAEWSATLDLTKLSGGSVSNTASGQYYGPSVIVARGNDGRLVPLIFDNSIGFGEDETASLADARANFGFWQRGLDENSVGPRLPYMNFAVPGAQLQAQSSLAAGKFKHRDYILRSVSTGLPFDLALAGDENEASTDSVVWRQHIDNALDWINATYGVPCATRTMLPKVSYVNNKPGTTLADQIPALDARLDTNSGLVANVAPAIICFQIGEAYHDAGTPSKWKVRPFTTTLAAAYSGTGTLSLSDAPVLGENLVFNDGSAGVVISTVIARSGYGPYTVTCNNPVPALANGAMVNATQTDGDGRHPSTAANIEYGTPVVAAGKINLFQFDAATLALRARFTGPVTYTHLYRIDAFIKALKAGANAWASLDAIYGIAGHDAQGAQQNWKADAFNLTVVGAPIFTAFQGYETDGIDDELDTDFNPSTAGGRWTQASAALGIWNLRDGQFTNSMAGWFDGTKGTTINPRTAADLATARVNQTGATTSTVANADALGLYIASRNSNSATGMTLRKNGSTLLLTSNITSTALVNSSLRLGRSSATGYAQAKFAMAFIGGALSQTQQEEIFAAGSAYLTAIGAI